MTVTKLLIYSWAVILALAIIIWSQNDVYIIEVLPINRWAAAAFLGMVIVYVTAQLGGWI